MIINERYAQKIVVNSVLVSVTHVRTHSDAT